MFEKIWIEKYRPKKLKEMVGQEEIRERLSGFINSKSLPHCLFSGPAGIGKTTAALCMANELFGQKWKANFLELNASDERGIDTIRTKVKDFARTMPINADFKIIYLDEADALTRDAQQALRRTMESYSSVCRFILACNYSSKIILPIQSRCAIFRFSRLDKENIKSYLEKVAKAEKIKLENGTLELIIDISEGDIRKCLNMLQTAAVSTKSKITKDYILQISHRAESKDVRDLLNYALGGEIKKVREKLYKLLFDYGISGEDLIKQIHKEIYNLDIDDEKKVKLLIKTGEYEFRLTEGSNEVIQLEALLAQFSVI